MELRVKDVGVGNRERASKRAREGERSKQKEVFIPGKTLIPPSGKLIGSKEIEYMISASLDGWLTTGRFNKEFEKNLADFLKIKHLITVNSGSSANLIAFSSFQWPGIYQKPKILNYLYLTEL